MGEQDIERRLDFIQSQLANITTLGNELKVELNGINEKQRSLAERLARLEELEKTLAQLQALHAGHAVWIKVLGGAVGAAITAIVGAWLKLVGSAP